MKNIILSALMTDGNIFTALAGILFFVLFTVISIKIALKTRKNTDQLEEAIHLLRRIASKTDPDGVEYERKNFDS